MNARSQGGREVLGNTVEMTGEREKQGQDKVARRNLPYFGKPEPWRPTVGITANWR